jgi:hypothetical protein
LEERRIEAKPGCGTVASAEMGTVGPLSCDVPKKLELGILRAIRGGAEAKGAAAFGGMDSFERNTLAHRI